MRDPAYWTEGPRTRALRDEIKRLATDPNVLERQDREQADVAAKLSPAEQRIKRVNANPALWERNHPITTKPEPRCARR